MCLMNYLMLLSEALCPNGPSTSFSHWEGIKWETYYNSRSWPVLLFTDVSLCHECSAQKLAQGSIVPVVMLGLLAYL